MTLLPKIADIFAVSIDALFGRSVRQAEKENAPGLPWPDDGTLRAVVFVGHQLVDNHPIAKDVTFHYEGDAQNIDSAFSVSCGDVEGNVLAGGNVNCGDIEGNLKAGGNVNCVDIEGNLKAGGNVKCADVGGDVSAGGMASCSDVGGSVSSGKDMMEKMWREMAP